MNFSRRLLNLLLPGLAMALLILDAKTGLTSARDGIELCLRTVIPALFPFLILSPMVTNQLMGNKIPLLSSLTKPLGIPDGCESILLVGFLGGYPVGAQSVAQAWRDGQLDKITASRMLGFCSNAGPSFLFGMIGILFTDWRIPWILWAIHIASALFVGYLLPGKTSGQASISKAKPLSLTAAMQRSVRVMAQICGWVVAFRILIGFADRWVLWLLPEEAKLLLTGILELSNGCCDLMEANAQGLRFILSSVFLGFGGLCVLMQTASVTGNLGLGYYFPGKILQATISFLMASAMQIIVFTPEQRAFVPTWALSLALLILLAAAVIFRKMKNNSSNPVLSGV